MGSKHPRLKDEADIFHHSHVTDHFTCQATHVTPGHPCPALFSFFPLRLGSQEALPEGGGESVPPAERLSSRHGRGGQRLPAARPRSTHLTRMVVVDYDIMTHPVGKK